MVEWYMRPSESRVARFIVPLVLLLATEQLTLAQKNQHADLVVINANIRTIVSKDSRAEALAVSGNRIASVGTNKRIKNFIGPATRVIDARGRLVLPGFTDAHVHFMGIGNMFSSLDLRNVNSANELMDRIARYA